MTKSEIADAILRGIRAFERGRIKPFDLAIYIERLGMELLEHDALQSDRLKDMAIQVAVSDAVENSNVHAALLEIGKLTQKIGGAQQLIGA